MTRTPEQKSEWWETLDQMRRQAQAISAPELASFVELIQRLVEGSPPAGLTPAVPADFRPYWDQIIAAIR